MGYTENYFKQKTKEITFIEIKEDVSIKINEYIIRGPLPLPVITEELLKEIKKGNLEEEINIGNIIEGIIFLMGVDGEFLYTDQYIEILLAYNPKIKDYIIYKGLKYFEELDLDNSAIMFRSLLKIDPNNIKALFNYALVLEEMAKELLEKEKDEESRDVLIASTNQLETILDIDENYSLAHYKLGFHYKHFQQFLKASLIWNKFLTLEKDTIRMQEIREELELIQDDAKFETGLTYLTYNDFGKALDSFLMLMPKYQDNWNANYLIGLSYKGLGEYEKAIEYTTIAINLNKTEADLYNELGIIYFNMGDIIKAIAIFTEGIDNCNADFKLFFNRGLGYVQLGQYDIALRDIHEAYKLNPQDDNVLLQKEKLEDLLSSI